MGPRRYSPKVSGMLVELRKHISRQTFVPAKPYRANLSYNKPVQRTVAPGAAAKLGKMFSRPMERKVAIEILREIRKGPVFMEDLSVNIANRHRNDSATLTPYGTTPGGVRTLYLKLVEKRLIREEK